MFSEDFEVAYPAPPDYGPPNRYTMPTNLFAEDHPDIYEAFPWLETFPIKQNF